MFKYTNITNCDGGDATVLTAGSSIKTSIMPTWTQADYRSSAIATGIVGIVFVLAFFIFLFILDIDVLIRQGRKAMRRMTGNEDTWAKKMKAKHKSLIL